MERRERWILAGVGVATVAVWVAISRLGDLNERVPLFLGVMAAAFAVYAVGVVVAVRVARPTGGALYWIVAVALASRLVLVPAPSAMSTDIYRYLWEGRIITHGHNPFAHAPDSPELEHLRDPYYERINHKDLETIYPPASQAAFALAAFVHPTPSAQKLLFVIFDVATVLVLIPLLRLRGIDPMAVIVYAWNPLVIFETGHSGHLDAIGIFLMVLGLWLVLRDRRAAAAAALAAGFLAKFTTAILVPFFIVRRRYAPWLMLAALVVVLGYLPFAGAGTMLFSSLRAYSEEWQFNGLAYRLVVTLWDNPLAIRWLLALAIGAVVMIRAVRETDILRYTFVAIGSALLLVPTLYPWYVSWIVPFLCVFRNRSWILFTALVFVSYWVWPLFAETGRWRLNAAVFAIEYAPFFGLLVFDALRARGRVAAA